MKSKKSLIIAPALAALFVAAAGSVSGTVAWFSAVRVFDTNISQFQVVETEGNLDVTMTPVANAGTIAGDIENTVKVIPEVTDESDRVVLTHGSVNHTNKTAFIQNPDDTSAFLNRGVFGNGEGDTWLYQPDVTLKDNSSNTHKVDVYVAVGWSMTFRYSFAGDANPVAIYLDLDQTKSVFSPDTASPDFTRAAATGKNEDTAKGFRISFMGGTHPLVWGNHVPGEELKGAKYQGAYSGSSSYSVGDYVLQDKKVYECMTATSSTAWETAQANFRLAPISVLSTDYAEHGKYAVGDTVKYDSKTYLCKTATDDAPAAFDTDNWDEIEVADLSYVSDGSTVTPYSTSDYVYSKATYSRLENLAENKSALGKAERITVVEVGKVNGEPNAAALAGNYGEVTVNCAAWYEGTDPNVISGAAMACLKAKMTVYARRVNNA